MQFPSAPLLNTLAGSSYEDKADCHSLHSVAPLLSHLVRYDNLYKFEGVARTLCSSQFGVLFMVMTYLRYDASHKVVIHWPILADARRLQECGYHNTGTRETGLASR